MARSAGPDALHLLEASVWVDDAAAQYEELLGRGAPIDLSLHDTPGGTREFGIQDLDGHDIALGQPLPPR